jgi:hypothetical protein
MLGIDVELTGPLFAGPITPKVERAIDATLQELIEKGEQRLGQILQPRPAGVYLSVQEAGKGKASKGHYRRNIHGEVKPDHSALITDGGVVYGPWLEGVSSRNEVTRFKGYSSFRKTAQWLEQQAPAVAERHAGQLVQELS